MTTLTRPATHAEINGTHDPLYTYELVAGKGLVARIPDAVPTEGERLGDVDLDLIAHLLTTTYGIPAVAEHMGGGCGAIAYGEDVRVNDGESGYFETPRWLAGPGTYMNRYVGHSTSSLHELGTSMDTYVAGTDDVGAIDCAAVGAVTHSQIAALFATVNAFGTVEGPLTNDRVEALGLDGSLRSTPGWLRDDMEAIAAQVAESNRLNRLRHEQAAAARSYIPNGY